MRFTLVFCAIALSLVSGRQAAADVFGNVPEASGYQLVYTLNIPNSASYDTGTAISYATDNHSAVTQPFDRIAYYLELQNGGVTTFAYASMDAFTTDPGKIGVPTTASGEFYQQNVKHMNVDFNGTVQSNLSSGNIEFWHYNYASTNSAGVPNASDSTYDFGDQSSGNADYGSMQIHDHATGSARTIMAYNNWGGNANNGVSDLGIGNNTATNTQNRVDPDWTFANNANTYTVKNLQVLVHLGAPAVSTQIMPLGDSITRGSQSVGGSVPGGYRSQLYTNLTNAGQNVSLVGSATDNASATLSTAGQTNHEGHDGYRIDQIANNLDASDGSGGNNGGFWLAGTGGRPALNPNFILLHIGTNDIGQSFNTATMATRLDSLVNQITTDRPSANLIVAAIIPLVNSAQNALVQAYNAQIPGIVQKYALLGRHVTFVDQYHNFLNPDGSVNASLLPDGVHPNQAGYNLMADTWSAAILAVPEPSSLAILLGAIASLGLAVRRRVRRRV